MSAVTRSRALVCVLLVAALFAAGHVAFAASTPTPAPGLVADENDGGEPAAESPDEGLPVDVPTDESPDAPSLDEGRADEDAGEGASAGGDDSADADEDAGADDGDKPPTEETHALLAPLSTCPGQRDGAYTGPGGRARQERALRCLINYARAKTGRRKLAADRRLAGSAAHRTARMKRCAHYGHFPCGERLMTAVRGAGYGRDGLVDAAEDLAWGYAAGDDRPRDAMLAWLRSPAHREAILDRRYRDLGVSIRKATYEGDRGVYVVANFGRERRR